MVYMNLENNIFQGLIKKDDYTKTLKKVLLQTYRHIDFLELYCFPCLLIISQVKPGSWQNIITIIYQTESVPANLSDYNHCRKEMYYEFLAIGPLQFNTGVQKKCPNSGKKCHACVDVVLLYVVDDRSASISRNLPCPEKFLVARLQYNFFSKKQQNLIKQFIQNYFLYYVS